MTTQQRQAHRVPRHATLLGLLVMVSLAAPRSAAATSWGNCASNDDQGYNGQAAHGFPNPTPGGNVIYGIRAYFDPAANFKRCEGVLPDYEGGKTEAWIATGSDVHENDILQIGIMDCNTPTSSSACFPYGAGSDEYPPGTKVYFWAFGYSCGTSSVIPVGQFLGWADGARHRYAVTITASGNVELRIDGTTRVTRALGSYCWLNDPADDSNVTFRVAGEVHDSTDGLGTSGSPSPFTGMDRQISAGGAWSDTNISVCTAITSTGDGHTACSVPSPTSMNVWTK